MDWDQAYQNTAYIKDGDKFATFWNDEAVNFRAHLISQNRAKLNLTYGAHQRHRYDMFFPNEIKCLFVFIHGGYWYEMNKDYWSHFTKTALEFGYLCAIPNYRLAPEVSISEIITDISNFINHIADLHKLPIIVAGHSAGGHLSTMLSIKNNSLTSLAQSLIRHIVPISPIADLEPIMKTKMNEILKITDKSMIYDSPIHNLPRKNMRITSIVGANERPEFLRQNALLCSNFKAKGADIVEKIIPNRHHFDIIDILHDPNFWVEIA